MDPPPGQPPTHQRLTDALQELFQQILCFCTMVWSQTEPEAVSQGHVGGMGLQQSAHLAEGKLSQFRFKNGHMSSSTRGEAQTRP